MSFSVTLASVSLHLDGIDADNALAAISAFREVQQATPDSPPVGSLPSERATEVSNWAAEFLATVETATQQALRD